MKSLKSLFALIAIVTLSFGCASVTDASLTDELNQAPDTQVTNTSDDVFTVGADVKPVAPVPD